MEKLEEKRGQILSIARRHGAKKIQIFAKKKSPEEAVSMLQNAHYTLEKTEWTTVTIEESMRKMTEEINWKIRDSFITLRIAVTGSRVSPPLFESMEILGKEKTLKRIASGINKINA